MYKTYRRRHNGSDSDDDEFRISAILLLLLLLLFYLFIYLVSRHLSFFVFELLLSELEAKQNDGIKTDFRALLMESCRVCEFLNSVSEK